MLEQKQIEEKTEQFWDRIVVPLQNKSGTAVRDIMDEAWDEDMMIWNTCYWRINSWLTSYFGRGTMSDEETERGFTRQEIGEVRFNAFLHSIGGFGYTLSISRLPRILSKLP